MKARLPLILAFLLPLFAVDAKDGGNAGVKAEKARWHDFTTGREVAIREKKPFFVDFYTDWCSWCKVMDQKTFAHPKVVEKLGREVIPCRINAEKTDAKIVFEGKTYNQAQLTQALGITGFPSLVFFDSEGKVLGVIPGYIEAPAFINLIDFVKDKGYLKYKSIDEYLAARNTAK